MSRQPDLELPSHRRHQCDVHVNFKMAYEIRVAIDQIRFAIRSSEQFGHDLTVMTEVRMQLLDTLQRLQTAERHFSQASQKATPNEGAQ